MPERRASARVPSWGYLDCEAAKGHWSGALARHRLLTTYLVCLHLLVGIIPVASFPFGSDSNLVRAPFTLSIPSPE